MSYILGIDVGYSHTKVYSKTGTDVFLSTVEEGTNEVNKKAITIEYKEKEYTIGEKTGNFSTDLNKIDDPIFRLCLYTAIARQIGDDITAEIHLITGLPAEYFKEQKQQLIDSLEGKSFTLVYKNIPRRITISNCIVFPQSAGVFILNPRDFEHENNIIIDCGGLTVDVALFHDYTLADTGTYELGMLKLYDKIVQAIKAAYKVSYDTLQAERIITTKRIIVNDKGIDVTNLVNDVLEKHTKKILMDVKNGFKEYSTSRRTFIGGGAYMLKDYLPGEVKKDDIYLNAKAFYTIGVNRFEN
jgi:plasmid segregation protein ParM